MKSKKNFDGRDWVGWKKKPFNGHAKKAFK